MKKGAIFMQKRVGERRANWGGYEKVGNILATVLCAIFAIILIINSTFLIQSYLDGDKVPDVFGYFPLVVLSDSMYPVIQSGDLAIYQKKPADGIAVGDVVAYYDPTDSNRQSIVTHRITGTVDEEGTLKFTTKGDANNSDDQTPVPYDDIVGVYRNRISGMGNVALFLQTTKGMLICIVIPLFLIVLLDGFGRGRTDSAGKTVDTEKADSTNQSQTGIAG
jgi:signal peptidase